MSIPRADGQSRGRSFIPDQKLAHLAAYEQAGHERQGGAYLSLEGVYSSVMSKCGRLRDAGVLEGKPPERHSGAPARSGPRSPRHAGGDVPSQSSSRDSS
jgi:transposase